MHILFQSGELLEGNSSHCGWYAGWIWTYFKYRHQWFQKVSAKISGGHLTDEHLTQFLKRCQKGLRPNGIIVIKDNVSYEGVVMDDVDSSVCRELSVLHDVIEKAGLKILIEEKQENFPDEIYHVYTIAMR